MTHSQKTVREPEGDVCDRTCTLTSVDPRCNPNTVNTIRPQRTRQRKRRVIRQLHSLIYGIAYRDTKHLTRKRLFQPFGRITGTRLRGTWSKRFLFPNTHSWLIPEHYMRLHIRALTIQISYQDFRARTLRVSHQSDDPFRRGFREHSRYVCVRAVGAGFELLGERGEFGDQGFGDAALYDDSFGRHAYLSSNNMAWVLARQTQRKRWGGVVEGNCPTCPELSIALETIPLAANLTLALFNTFFQHIRCGKDQCTQCGSRLLPLSRPTP